MLCVWLELPYKRCFACVSSSVVVVVVLCLSWKLWICEEWKSCVCLELKLERAWICPYITVVFKHLCSFFAFFIFVSRNEGLAFPLTPAHLHSLSSSWRVSLTGSWAHHISADAMLARKLLRLTLLPFTNSKLLLEVRHSLLEDAYVDVFQVRTPVKNLINKTRCLIRIVRLGVLSNEEKPEKSTRNGLNTGSPLHYF